MAIHKLTEQTAKLLDEVLKFTLESNTNKDQAPYNHGEFILNKYLNEEDTPSELDIKSAFFIADNFLKDVSKPYAIKPNGIFTNNYTDSFLHAGGFYSMWEDNNAYVDKKIAWYWSPMFKYIVWPILVLVAGTYILFLLKIIH